MNTVTYASELRSIFNRNAYSTLIANMGTQLNDRKDRFDKSDIIEQAVAVYSGDRLAWVDLIGRDHVDSVTGFDLEFKYVSDGLFTKAQKLPKEVVNVKLKNNLGSHKGITVDHPADFYMIGQHLYHYSNKHLNCIVHEHVLDLLPMYKVQQLFHTIL